MKEIPRATARRLPIYHRYLRYLYNAGKHRISSTLVRWEKEGTVMM